MVTRVLTVVVIATLLLSFGLIVNASDKGTEGDVKIGGHVKMQLFDQSTGTSTVSGTDYDNTDKFGFGFGGHSWVLFLSKDITENLSIEIAPDYTLGSAGATPKIGKKIGAQRKSTSSTTNTPTLKLNQEWVKYNIPEYKLELRAGYMNCLFTWDYGKELAWHEEYNFNKASLYLGAWHDSGIEAYRNFELGSVSLPVYAYLLNGSGGTSYTDNNKNKTIMLHTEPSFSGKLAALKTHVSYGFGAWGDEEYTASYSGAAPTAVAASLKNAKYSKWALGASYDYQKFSVRAEYMGGNWEKKINYGTATEEDQGSIGSYVKVFYTIMPEKLRAMLDYSQYKTESNATTRETYKTTTLGLLYELAPAATLMLQIDMCDWSNDKAAEDALDFTRVTTGVRITF